jgi:hypothetical protein
MTAAGGRSSIAVAAWVACALIGLPHDCRGEGLEETSLIDGRFHTVSQPVPGDAPATPTDQPLTPPPRPRGPSAPQPGAQARSFGGARGPQSSAPNMIGDFFGSGGLQIILQPPPIMINTVTNGFGASTNFNDPLVPVQFALNANGPAILTSGAPGIDASGDTLLDTWPVTNVPPQLTPVPPGTGTLVLSNGNLLVFTQGSGDAVDGRPDGIGPGGSGFFPGFQLFLTHTFTPGQIVIEAPNPSGGGSVGRVKIAENNSPIPRDRVFHNYSFFNNVPLTSTGVDVNRFVPGFEKTFCGGIGSIELRFPFASTLDSEIVAGGAAATDEVEFGNISIPLKVLLFQNDCVALAAGLQVSLPTADDTVVRLADGTQLLRIQNESFHWMPYLGLLLTPNDRLFMQGFVQVDADSEGSPVLVSNFTTGLVPVGRLDDAQFLYVDLGVGYWLHRSHCPRGLTGIAPTLELHINRSLDDPGVLQTGSLVVNTFDNRLDSTNLVVGTMFEWNQNTSLTFGYAVPLSDDDRQFDGELRVLFNHRFGPQTRASRAQF